MPGACCGSDRIRRAPTPDRRVTDGADESPTVTDALLVLGFLDADRFLGGDMQLDVDAARAACAELGATLGLDAEECAWGIRRLALEGMATAVRSLLDARGLNGADFSLASYGGCGALFTADLATTLGIDHVLIPELSSVLSAFGAATADLQRERVRSLACLLPGGEDALEKVGRRAAGPSTPRPRGRWRRPGRQLGPPGGRPAFPTPGVGAHPPRQPAIESMPTPSTTSWAASTRSTCDATVPVRPCWPRRSSW